MPVAIKGKKAVLSCETCGTQLEVPAPGGVAQDLKAAEYAHEHHNWGYQVGFAAMMLGTPVFCPKCARPTRYEEC